MTFLELLNESAADAAVAGAQVQPGATQVPAWQPALPGASGLAIPVPAQRGSPPAGVPNSPPASLAFPATTAESASPASS